MKQELIIPDVPKLSDMTRWERNIEVVKMLYATFEVTKFLTTPSGYESMPYVYQVDGIQMEFLPHWANYSVLDVSLHIPTSIEEVLSDVAFVKNRIWRT